jgi:hypothetical protein
MPAGRPRPLLQARTQLTAVFELSTEYGHLGRAEWNEANDIDRMGASEDECLRYDAVSLVNEHPARRALPAVLAFKIVLQLLLGRLTSD